MNIELTTKCPLHCPQCYCSLDNQKDIDLETAVYWIAEGKRVGVEYVELSGGETLCYPYLTDLISRADAIGVKTNIAISGAGFSQTVFNDLIAAGVSGIFVSLNGSTEEINAKTRDGYTFAIHALEVLRDNHYQNTAINWVMHSVNADDFINIIHLAEQYNVSTIVIIGLKPDSKKMLRTYPSLSQFQKVREIIRTYSGHTKIKVESCFSPMLAYVCDTKLLGNLNTGRFRGCGAGDNTFSVNVDGLLSPCRHLDHFEKYTTIEEYFEKSELIAQLRSMRGGPSEGPCISCIYMNFCIPCVAVNSKTEHRVFKGFYDCPLSIV